MEQSWMLLFQSALLGVGLAMDAFSVSLANGLQEPKMPKGRMARIAGVFAGFQAPPRSRRRCARRPMRRPRPRRPVPGRIGFHVIRPLPF